MTSPNHKDHESWKKYTFFSARVRGIPCEVGYTWVPECRGYRDKYGQWEPDEPAGVEDICIMDRRGYHAAWMEELVEAADAWEEVKTLCSNHASVEMAEPDYEPAYY